MVGNTGKIAVLLISLLASGCASGRKISELSPAEQAVPKGQSRIVVYRTAMFGMAVQPQIEVDGKPTGPCMPGGAFFVNVTPGRHDVSATTEVTRSVSVEALKGKSAYVECSIGIGVFMGRPELQVISPEGGAVTTPGLVLTASY